MRSSQYRIRNDVADLFAELQEHAFPSVGHAYHRSVDNGHGHMEVGQWWTVHERSDLQFATGEICLRVPIGFGRLRSARRISSTRNTPG